MTSQEHFRVSSHLKDIIGRDLVTNEFVAVFELVKNSFDAGARRVDVVVDNDADELWIVDDGKGMDADGIRDRWLFVAYSAKANGTEDPVDYRDRIRPAGQFAGSKGIGRFSCDTLGRNLQLYSRTSQRTKTNVLRVEWSRFEASSRRLFQLVGVELEEVDRFPADGGVAMPRGSGTALRISGLRQTWDLDRIWRLRQYLGKLIDPFGSTEDVPVHISVIDSEMEQDAIDWLSGPVGNDIRDLLDEKTTRIRVEIVDGSISSELVDRGRPIYRIREESPYEALENVSVRMEIYFLNRSAKQNFKLRMGVTSVEFGSVFLFLNGFRIFPYGEENDDSFGLNRRKQQGTSRYLGTRDLLGRVDVEAATGMFREASSRDAGFIEDVRVSELFDAIRRKAIFRLERYVVGVTWPDRTDADRDDASGLDQVSSRSRAAAVVAQLASNANVDVEYYAPDIVEVFEAESSALDKALGSLVAIAQHSGDQALLSRIEAARLRQMRLESAEREAAAAAREARAEIERANLRIATLERQATYLAATQDMTAEQMVLLLHQVVIYSSHIAAALDRAFRNCSEIAEAATEMTADTDVEDLRTSAATIRVRTRGVVDDLEYIHLDNDRLMAVARFASNARFELETDMLHGDVVEFLDEYVNQVGATRENGTSIRFSPNGQSQQAGFRPVDLVVVIDNLRDNARKHGAREMVLSARPGRNGGNVQVLVSDDGRGLDENRVDPSRLFDKGYTSSDEGTGLGLFHARKVLQDMGGSLSLDPERAVGRAEFVIELPGEHQ